MDASRAASHSTLSGGLRLRGAVAAIVCAALAFLCAGAQAGLELWPDSEAGSGFGSYLPTSGRASLLDPSRLGISHQMVFSYSSGSSGRNNVGGLWLTNFSYKFASPLTVDLSVGASLSKTGGRELDAQNLFLEGLSLRYRPSENLYFHFSYRGAPDNWFLHPESLTR